MMLIHSLFDHHVVDGVFFKEPSLTQQHFAPDADINTIVNRYVNSGVLPDCNRLQGVYADLSEVPSDYQAALDHVRAADAMFAQLPSGLRREFDNDPGKFLHAMHDPAFLPRAIELGLVNSPTPQPAPQPAPEPAQSPSA